MYDRDLDEAEEKATADAWDACLAAEEEESAPCENEEEQVASPVPAAVPVRTETAPKSKAIPAWKAAAVRNLTRYRDQIAERAYENIRPKKE